MLQYTVAYGQNGCSCDALSAQTHDKIRDGKHVKETVASGYSAFCP